MLAFSEKLFKLGFTKQTNTKTCCFSFPVWLQMKWVLLLICWHDSTFRCGLILSFRYHGLKLSEPLSRTVTSTMDVKTCCTCSAMKPQWLPNPKQRTFLAQLFRPSIILTEQCPSSTSTQAHTRLILTLSPYQMELKPLLSMLLVHNIRYIDLLALNILCVVYSAWSYPVAESVWVGVGSNDCYSSQRIFWIIIFNLGHIFMVAPAWLVLIIRPQFEIYLCRKGILISVISRLQGASEYPHNSPTEYTPKRKSPQIRCRGGIIKCLATLAERTLPQHPQTGSCKLLM